MCVTLELIACFGNRTRDEATGTQNTRTRNNAANPRTGSDSGAPSKSTTLSYLCWQDALVNLRFEADRSQMRHCI